MKIKRFKELNESDTNQIPDTQLHKYYKYYKMWCDENNIEYNFDKVSQKDIISKAIKYAKDNNLPNMNYFDSEE
jgi:hypothetical protein